MNAKVFAVCLIVLVNSASAECLKYEPAISEVKGILVEKFFPGPPNYEDYNAGDAKETAMIVDAGRPFCVKGDQASELNSEGEDEQKELHLVILNDKLWPVVRGAIGKRVVVRGSLFHAHTGHHRTPVLMELKELVTE